MNVKDNIEKEKYNVDENLNSEEKRKAVFDMRPEFKKDLFEQNDMIGPKAERMFEKSWYNVENDDDYLSVLKEWNRLIDLVDLDADILILRIIRDIKNQISDIDNFQIMVSREERKLSDQLKTGLERAVSIATKYYNKL